MSNWKSFEEATPEFNKLVLVKQEMTGVCLRSFNADGDAYDEHEIYDDSELEFFEWCEIPK